MYIPGSRYRRRARLSSQRCHAASLWFSGDELSPPSGARPADVDGGPQAGAGQRPVLTRAESSALLPHGFSVGTAQAPGVENLSGRVLRAFGRDPGQVVYGKTWPCTVAPYSTACHQDSDPPKLNPVDIADIIEDMDRPSASRCLIFSMTRPQPTLFPRSNRPADVLAHVATRALPTCWRRWIRRRRGPPGFHGDRTARELSRADGGP